MKKMIFPLGLAALVAGLSACSDNKSEIPAKPAAQAPADSGSAPTAGVADKAVSAVKDTAQQAASAAKDAAQQATTAAKDAAQQATAVAKDAVQQATTAVSDVAKQATASAKATQASTALADTAARVKAQVEDALAKAQQYVGQGKLQEAQDLLKSLSDLKLTPEQQKAIDDLKAKITSALSAAKAIGGDALKTIPGLPKP